MALTAQEKTNVKNLAKHFLGSTVLNIVTRENYGAEVEEKQWIAIKGYLILRALENPDVDDMLTESEQEILYQRLMSLLDIKTDN